MKKMLIAGAALAVASVVTAQTVSSANIVGYDKNARPSLQIIGSAWKTSSLDSVVGLNYLAGPMSALADKVFVYTATGYQTYYLYSPTFMGTPVEWRNAATEANDGVVQGGSAIWLESQGLVAGDVITSGEVEQARYITNNIPAGLSMLSYPFSAPVDNINNLALLTQGFSLSIVTPNPALSDKMYIYTPGVGYTTYFIHDDGIFGREWRDAANPDSTLSGTVSLNIGDGFFFESVVGVTWIEESPYWQNL